jgi:hypothetical protein
MSRTSLRSAAFGEWGEANRHESSNNWEESCGVGKQKGEGWNLDKEFEEEEAVMGLREAEGYHLLELRASRSRGNVDVLQDSADLQHKGGQLHRGGGGMGGSR